MHHVTIVGFLANLLVILLSAKLFGELAERWGQPAVLGELVGGVVLGAGFVTFFHADDPVLSLMAELGVILLLFETGLESDLSQLLKAGPVSIAVATLGVIAPFVFGYGVMRALGYAQVPSVLMAAAMTATSVGITARVLSELGKLGRMEAQIILGAAVIDDMLGIVILSVVQGMGEASGASLVHAGRTAAMAIVFVAGTLIIGPWLSRTLMRLVEKMRARGALVVASVSFAFAMALIAHWLGTAMIVGAFGAGMVLAQTHRQAHIREALVPIADIFVPIFFVMVGAKVVLRNYNPMVPENWSMIGLSMLLILVAVIGKLISGRIAWPGSLNRWAIGVGMIPRGEVGLIFAQIGLASKMIDPALYTAVISMVLATTFITPPLLKKVFR